MDKNQIKSDFSSLLKNYHAHRHQVATKEELVSKQKSLSLLETAKSYTPDNIVKGLGNLQLTFSDTLSEWTIKLQTEAEKRKQIEDAIEIEKNRLDNLRQVRLAADALYLLKEEHQAKLSELEEEHQKRIELINTSRKEDEAFWQKEVELFEKETKESEERRQKTRQKEEENYAYDLERTTQLSTDAFDGQKKQALRKLEEQQTEKEKAWSTREEILTEKDTQHQKNLTLIAEFDEKLKEEVKKARDTAAAEASRTIKAEAELLEREETANAQIFAEQIEDLKHTIDANTIEIEKLTTQLNNALEKVQSLSMKAFEPQK